MADISEEPPFLEWAKSLQQNFALRSKGWNEIFDLKSVRKEVFEAAEIYERSLGEIAKNAGVTLERVPHQDFTPSNAIVMSGHQPVIYHSGLIRKNLRLSELAAYPTVSAINVIIDTDEGLAGEFSFPIEEGGEPVIKRVTLARPKRLFYSQIISNSSEVKAVFDEILKSTYIQSNKSAFEQIKKAGQLYSSLEGVPAAQANAIVRSHFERRNYLELPLSKLSVLPEVRKVISKLCENPLKLFEQYNSALVQFREERKIKNEANPFPNLDQDPSSLEMPLWIIDLENDSRTALRVNKTEKTFPNLSEKVVVPRGMLITFLLRGVLSDMFIHGLGGGRYDPVVDLFAKKSYGIELPPFVVASETKRFLQDEYTKLEKADSLRERYKEVVSHTSKFLGQGLFGNAFEAELKTLDESRVGMLETLKNAAPADRSKAAHELNALNKKIREVIEGSQFRENTKMADISPAVRAAIESREFPYFFFNQTF